MTKKKVNKSLLESELKRHKLMVEYSFYVGEDDEYDKDVDNLILGEDGDEENDQEDFGGNEEEPQEFNDTSQDLEQGDDNNGDIPQDNIQQDNTPQEILNDPQTGENEVELDITELVQGTADAKQSADMATQKISDLISKFDELQGKIANMDVIAKKIDDLEHQVEKRNPTPDEKLEMRSFDSYPYNLKLSDYWAEKGGKYDVLGTEDNPEGTKKEYVLTTDDIKTQYNDYQVKNSFNDEYEEEEF